MSTITPHINVNEELKNYLTQLSEEEYNTLKESILREGIRDPIIIWQETNDIVDGYNRYAICTNHNIKYELKYLSFKSIEDVKEWMLQNQLGRRNLTIEKQKYFIGELYSLRKKKQGAQANNQNAKKQTGKLYQFENNEMQIEDTYEVEEEVGTSKQIAQEYSISEKTVRNNEKFKQAVDKLDEHSPGLKNKILAGEVKLSQEAVSKVLTVDETLLDDVAALSTKDVNTAIKTVEKELADTTDEDTITDVNGTFQKYVLSKMIALNVDLKQLINAWDLIDDNLKNEFKSTVLAFKNILKNIDEVNQNKTDQSNLLLE